MLGGVGSTFRDASSRLLDLVYPRVCLICDRLIEEPDCSLLCAACEAGVPDFPGRTCPTCSESLGPNVLVQKRCDACKGRPLHFQQAVSTGPYVDGLRDLVLALKFRKRMPVGPWLAHRLSSCVQSQTWATALDGVVPSPIHWRRRMKRGFNQAEIIAAQIERDLELPRIRMNKVRNTIAQSMLDEYERRKNVRDAFVLPGSVDVSGQTLLVVDDVMTTCCTAAEIARSLKQAGARRVYVAVVAR